MGTQAEKPALRQRRLVPYAEPFGATPLSYFRDCGCRCCSIVNRDGIVVSTTPAPTSRTLAQGERGPHDLCRCFRQYRTVAIRSGNRGVVGHRALPGDTEHPERYRYHARYVPG